MNSINFFDKLTHQIIDKRLEENNYEREFKQIFVSVSYSILSSFYRFFISNGKPDFCLSFSLECNDLVALMMREYSTEKNQGQILKGITKEEISGQGLIFYIAGQDTTNAAFNSAIYYLTHYPEW